MRLDSKDIQSRLSTSRFGREIESLGETDSTNTLAIERARAGAPEGTVILADSQRRGRGRLRREWASPPGCNLYCSVILRPPLTPRDVPPLTLAAGLATAEAVAHWVREGVTIKWPNDVLIHGRKAAGILTEVEGEGQRVAFVVVGIGVNVNAKPEDFPEGVRPIATSIAAATGSTVPREAVCARLLERLEARYETVVADGCSAIVPAWQKWDGLKDRSIEVRDGERVISGIARGLGSDGRLRVETSAGMREIVAGDVTVVGGYAAAARG